VKCFFIGSPLREAACNCWSRGTNVLKKNELWIAVDTLFGDRKLQSRVSMRQGSRMNFH